MFSTAYNLIFSNVVATLSDTLLNQLEGNKRCTENVTVIRFTVCVHGDLLDIVIFSNVVATLSDTLLNQLEGNKRDILSDIVCPEKVKVVSDANSDVYSLSGDLHDLVVCQKKLERLLMGYMSSLDTEGINDNQLSEHDQVQTDENTEGINDKLDTEGIDNNQLSEHNQVQTDENTEGINDKLDTEGINDNQLSEHDQVQTDENTEGINDKLDTEGINDNQLSEHDQVQTDENKPDLQSNNEDRNETFESQTQQENIKPHRKRKKKPQVIEAVHTEIKVEVGDSDRKRTKRGRVIKRPSRLANSVVEITDKHDTEKKISVGCRTLQGMRKVETKIIHVKPEKVDYDLGFSITEEMEKNKEFKKKVKQHYENKMPFKYFCDKCSFKSKRESHYNNHMKLHEQNPDLKLIKCTMCDFTCIRQSLLKKHQSTHQEDGLNIKCSLCQYETNSAKLINHHMNKKHYCHGQKLKCSVCDFTTFSKTILCRHMERHSSENQKVYNCDSCSYSTKKRVHFERHKKYVHSNVRPHLCDLCGAAFKRTDTLANHKLTHLDMSKRKLPFKCTKCQKAFKSRAHLASHMYVHSNVKAFQCHICGQMFKTKQVQQKHIQNIHSNPRSFKCGTCMKDFNTKYTLQRHEKTHENDIVGNMNTNLSTDVLTDKLKLEQQNVKADENQSIVVQYNELSEETTASTTLNEVQEGENIIGKESMVQQAEIVDENISAIQQITLNEIERLGTNSEHFQSTNDIGTIYIEGLDTVVDESGAINIVNLDVQSLQQLQQILIPRSGTSTNTVNIGQFISQINPSSVTQQSDTKGSNSVGLSEIYVSTESLMEGGNCEGLSGTYVSTVDVKHDTDGQANIVDAGEISGVYVEADQNSKEVKQILLQEFTSNMIQTGEIIVSEDTIGEENQTT